MESVEGPLLALTLVLMVVGLVGSVVPGLPGVTLIFLSALLYAVLTDFQTIGAAVLVLLFVFAGIAGALIGLLFLGIGSLLGLILGTIAGVFIGEYLKRERRGGPQTLDPAQSDWRRASRAAGGVLVGYVASAVIQG